MAKIRITEIELMEMVRKCVCETIEEITLKQASVGGIYNVLSMDDIKKGNSSVTFGRGHKSSIDRLNKSNEIEWELLSKAILDKRGRFNLFFVQPDGGIGNKVITLTFESILYVGNNGFILYGDGKISGKTISRGKVVDNFKKIKVFYNADSKSYSWINTYKINSEKYIRATSNNNLMLPKGNANEMLKNQINEDNLFSDINEYIGIVNASVPSNLTLKL